MRRTLIRTVCSMALGIPVLALLAACNDSEVLYPPGDGNGSGRYPSGTGIGLNESACPLQYTERVAGTLTGDDPLLGRQWHLNNSGQSGGTAGQDLRAFEAWQNTRGLGTRVAVIDDAIEVVHEDLVPNVLTGQSYNYRPSRLGSAFPLPCNQEDSHGTAVTGIIAARGNNALGVSGVAPEASLVGYNALATGLDSDIADALNRAPEANQIYHNSWGAPDDGALHAADPSFIAAIDAGLRQGRGGKGSIFVFAAGNGGCYGNDSTGSCLRENSNYDGFVNKLGVVTACAVDNDGARPFYGETGANFLVCGPSSNNTIGITTTTISNTYRNDFTGTSASTPMVSGVIALLLANHPELTWRDVQQILVRSARQNSPTDPGWSTQFGLHFNPSFGFGAVDAQAALSFAQTWTSIGGYDSLKSCGPYQKTPNLAIPDLNGNPVAVDDAITVVGCGIEKIEFVEIRVSATHVYSGDLDIKLVSPLGLVSELAGGRLCANSGEGDSCGSYDDWPFGSVRHLDEPSNGQWKLRVTDVQRDDAGTLNRWTLTFYGR